MPAEWENPSSILMAYPAPHTDWNYILPEARAQFDAIIRALVDGEERVILLSDGSIEPEVREMIKHAGGLVIEDIDYTDTWTRDYGPITIVADGRKIEIDFGFNGWGLKFAADKDNLVNLQLIKAGHASYRSYLNRRDFILEGGSIESDGKGTILTTSRCLCSDNRNGGLDKLNAEANLRRILGAKHVLWLDYGFLEGDDTDSHIDTLARLAPDDSIIYVAPPEDEDDVHYAELKEMELQLKGFKTAEGAPFRLIPLPFPDAIYDEDGQRLPATYANYLVTGTNIFIPTYGQPEKDARAVEAIGSAFPNHRVFTVDCRTLIRQHGSLHCSTMQKYSELSFDD